MKRKNILTITLLFVAIILSYPTMVNSDNELDATIFPVNLNINGNTYPLSDEYVYLNYNGYSYFPIRFLAEAMNYSVGYDEGSSTVFLDNRPSGGVVVSNTEAKLFAYEQLNVKKVVSIELRSITKEEADSRPEQAQKITNPIYWVMQAINQSGEMIYIYVHSIYREVFFIK